MAFFSQVRENSTTLENSYLFDNQFVTIFFRKRRPACRISLRLTHLFYTFAAILKKVVSLANFLK